VDLPAQDFPPFPGRKDFVFFIGQVWSVKIVEYWPRSFLRFIDLSSFSVQEGWILVNIPQPS